MSDKPEMTTAPTTTEERLASLEANVGILFEQRPDDLRRDWDKYFGDHGIVIALLDDLKVMVGERRRERRTNEVVAQHRREHPEMGDD